MLSDRRIRTSLVAIATDLTLTALKLVLAIVTGSAALQADAFHSATDLIVSVVLLIGIVIRFKHEKQSDSQSNWGHIVESSLAIFVAVIILYVPYEIISGISANNTQEIKNLPIGIFGTIAIIFIVLFISRFKLFVGRETDSIALEADGYHSMVDVFTSIAVLVSLIGYMVGIYLDEIVAVVIAIMIAVTGLELLVSGIKALIKKTAFDQISFYESMAEVYSNTLGKYPISKRIFELFQGIYRYRLFLIVLILSIYFLSGFKAISSGNVGKKYQLGAVVSDNLSAGLHYALPWPLGRIDVFEDGAVYVVHLGARSEELSVGQQRIWTEVKERFLQDESTNYLVTNDEQLIDISLTVFYKIDNAPYVIGQLNAHDDFVKYISHYSFNRFVLSHSLEGVLSGDRTELKGELTRYIQNDLDAIFDAIDVVDVQFQTYRLPAVVIGAYRDVINAQQEKLQSINNAVAERLKALPLSRATYTESIASAESKSQAEVLKAEGNIAQITGLSKIQQRSREAYEFNTYINVINEALNEKEIVIRDKNLSSADLRVWNKRSE